MTSGVTAGVNISYDEAFDTRVSADIKVRFGGPSTTEAKKKKRENPTIDALTASPKNRDVRVHDATCQNKWYDFFLNPFVSTCSYPPEATSNQIPVEPIGSL